MSVQCPQGLEEGVGSLELKLQMVISHHVGAGNQTVVLWKTVSGIKC